MIITLKQYIEIDKLQKIHKDSDQLGIEILRLITGKDIKQLSLEESESILTTVYKEIDIKDFPLVHRFKINGISFGFIPNLEDITVGEFIDLETLFNQEDLQLEEIMSILYRPVKKRWFNTYSIEEYTGSDKYNELYLKTDFKIILGAIVFFCTLRKSLLNHIATYTPKRNLKKETIN